MLGSLGCFWVLVFVGVLSCRDRLQGIFFGSFLSLFSKEGTRKKASDPKAKACGLKRATACGFWIGVLGFWNCWDVGPFPLPSHQRQHMEDQSSKSHLRAYVAGA